MESEICADEKIVDYLSVCSRLHDSEQWQDLRDYIAKEIPAHFPSDAIIFFKATALLKLKDFAAALREIETANARFPDSVWGRHIEFHALVGLDRVLDAVERLQAAVRDLDDESLKILFVQYYVEADGHITYEQAAAVNESRAVIKDVDRTPRYALCLQIFNKPDTLESVLNALLKLRKAEDFALVIIQDGLDIRNLDPGKHFIHQTTTQLVVSGLPALSKQFYSVEFLSNRVNMGTAPTCRKLLDYVTSRYDGFLFIEDDCLLSEDGLEFASTMLEHHLDASKHWFFSAESSFFNSSDANLSPETRARLAALASRPALSRAYVPLNFVPSTCFGTRSEFWKICNKARSFPRGPESLSKMLADKGLKTLAPIVPRASDIGMQHPQGYSTTTLGPGNVRESKHTFLLANTDSSEPFAPYRFDLDDLFRATCAIDVDQIAAVETQVPRADADGPPAGA